MGVQVTAGLGVDQANRSLVTDKPGLGFLVVIGFLARRVEEPVIVGILVVVASDLLLSGAFRICPTKEC